MESAKTFLNTLVIINFTVRYSTSQASTNMTRWNPQWKCSSTQLERWGHCPRGEKMSTSMNHEDHNVGGSRQQCCTKVAKKYAAKVSKFLFDIWPQREGTHKKECWASSQSYWRSGPCLVIDMFCLKKIIPTHWGCIRNPQSEWLNLEENCSSSMERGARLQSRSRMSEKLTLQQFRKKKITFKSDLWKLTMRLLT